MIAGKYFVTPHAVRQFQKRMAWNMSYEEALAEIIKGLKYDIKSIKLNHTGAQIIRVDGKWKFRAVVRDNVVVTILKSGKGGARCRGSAKKRDRK
jgi:predicted fused transcriptional regulator/phosphomethylpyrimidine kinase